MKISLLALLVTALVKLSGGQYQEYNFQDPTRVKTSNGDVVGTITSIGDGMSAVSFIGIPYAAAPLRGNRFRDPQPVVRWFREKIADKRIQCPQTEARFRLRDQPNIPEDEDCLYLNVHVPNRPGRVQMYPVIFYIHGGEFKYGGKDYIKPDFLMREDVILVVPNYRLGVLGFLGTDDYHGPGNFGIKDQIAALKWVTSEIQNFHGDRSAVTIMGHDAGAVSAHMMMFIPSAAGLFHKTIINGGSVFSPWAFQEDPAYQAKRFGLKFSCKGWSRDIVRCLRDRGAKELIREAKEYEGFWFRPVVDKNVTYGLLNDWPERLYQNQKVARVPLLAGLTANEGSLDYFYRYSRNWESLPNKQRIEAMLRPYMKRYARVELISSSIEYHYFSPWNRTSSAGYGRQGAGFGNRVNTDEVFIKIMGDFLYNAPVDKALRLHNSISDSYLYYFTYKGEKSFGSLQNSEAQVTRDAYGVSHTDDLFYVLSTEYDRRMLEAGAREPSAQLIRLVKSFAQNSPNYVGLRKYIQGTSVTYNSVPNAGNNQMYPNLYSEYNVDDLSFWNTIINDIIEITATPPPYFPYNEYEAFKAATWSLVSLLILSLLLLAILIFIIYRRNRDDRRRLDFLKARRKDADERELEKL